MTSIQVDNSRVKIYNFINALVKSRSIIDICYRCIENGHPQYYYDSPDSKSALVGKISQENNNFT